MNLKKNEHSFLTGGGEMGELIRTKDWSKTSLGTFDNWPQSLRTTLSIILNSKFPMFLWWGQELTCFYNDAYRPSLGNDGKHPSILGNKGEDSWKEIWPIIHPLLKQVQEGEGATWSENQLIPFFRNGKIEDIYWTFSYSPIYDESGSIAGIMTICTETTASVIAFKKLEESNAQFFKNIMQAPVAMCIFKGKNHVLEIANKFMLELIGKELEEVINKPMFDGMPEVKNQGLEEVIDAVYSTGVKFVATERLIKLPRNGKLEDAYISFVYEALKENDGSISGIIAVATDVTEQVLSRKKVKDSEQKVRAIVENAPFPIAVYVGKEMIVELANESITNLWGKGKDVIGKSFKELLPELSNQLVFEQIKNVFETGKAFHTKNTALDLLIDGKLQNFYFNYSFNPLYDINGNVYAVMNTGVDVTDINLANKKLEESERNLRSMVLRSPLGICVLDAKTLKAEIVNDSFIEVSGKSHEEISGHHYWETFPETRAEYEPILANVIEKGIPFYANEEEIILSREGKEVKAYLTFIYTPLINSQGEVAKVVIWLFDTSAQVNAKQKIADVNKLFRDTVQQAPVGITILRGPEFIVEMANDAYLQLIDRKEIDFVGKPLFESLPEAQAVAEPLLNNVLSTGIAYHGNELPVPIRRFGEQQICYFDFLYHALREENGNITGIIVTVVEVTEKLESLKKTEQNELRLNIILDASELGTWEFNLKTKEITYSERFIEIMSGLKDEKNIKHAQLVNWIHPDDLADRQKAHQDSFISGYLNYEARVIWHDESIHWIEVKGKLFKDSDENPDKLLGTLRDITDEKMHQKEMEESEQKFRLLADSMPQFIWTADPQGNLNYFNNSVFTFSGLSPEELVTNGWLEMVHPEERTQNIKVWLNAITTGKDFLFEHRFRRHDGEFRWQLSRAIPQLNDKGEIQMWVGSSTDIQEQKTFANNLEKLVKERTKELRLINESLEKSEERYHLMIEEVQDYAILYLDINGNVQNWNLGAQKIKGYKAEDIIGKNFSVFYTASDLLDNLPQSLLKTAQEKGKVKNEGWRVKKNGKLFWANVVITVVRNKKNEIIGYSKVTHDLTDRKKADDQLKLASLQLKQKNDALENANKELQSFAYISSHDLQEPLRKIQTFSSQIIDNELHNLSDNGKDKFKRMQNAAQRMQVLINDLLTYSRTGIQDAKFEKTDLATIIEKVEDDLKEELENKNLSIEINEICEVNIIPFQFRQLIYNIISNSIKFAKADNTGEIKVTCKIAKGKKFNFEKLSNDENYCHISISDNGIGFEQEFSNKIFEVFQRLHGRSEFSGTGIGLAIVKKIVDNHEGFITATGKLNEGATFDIYIPVR